MNNKYKFSLLKNIFKRKNVGFSLVEIVIVIAVIAILATVLIPTFSSIIDKSNDIKLIQNARIKYIEAKEFNSTILKTGHFLILSSHKDLVKIR